MRERGLKLLMAKSRLTILRSLPVRERGLKSNVIGTSSTVSFVAPRAGAWIEIISQILSYATEVVAPRAGAWIEMGTKIA